MKATRATAIVPPVDASGQYGPGGAAAPKRRRGASRRARAALEPIPLDVWRYTLGIAIKDNTINFRVVGDLLCWPQSRTHKRQPDGAGDPECYREYAAHSTRYVGSANMRAVLYSVLKQIAKRKDGTYSCYLSRGRVEGSTGLNFSTISRLWRTLADSPTPLFMMCGRDANNCNIFEAVTDPHAFAPERDRARELKAAQARNVAQNQVHQARVEAQKDLVLERIDTDEYHRRVQAAEKAGAKQAKVPVRVLREVAQAPRSSTRGPRQAFIPPVEMKAAPRPAPDVLATAKAKADVSGGASLPRRCDRCWTLIYTAADVVYEEGSGRQHVCLGASALAPAVS